MWEERERESKVLPIEVLEENIRCFRDMTICLRDGFDYSFLGFWGIGFCVEVIDQLLEVLDKPLY